MKRQCYSTSNSESCSALIMFRKCTRHVIKTVLPVNTQATERSRKRKRWLGEEGEENKKGGGRGGDSLDTEG